MRIMLPGLALALTLSGCVTPGGSEPRWAITTTAAATGASLIGPGGAPLITVACTSGGGLRVRVPGFRAVGSEDRLSFGLSDDPVALVAELPGGPSGVSASGPIPPEMAERLGSATAVRASYGSQSVGPFLPPSGAAKDTLARACAMRR